MPHYNAHTFHVLVGLVGVVPYGASAPVPHHPHLRCNTGEYPQVRVPVIFSKAITRTQQVFRHRYPPPTGDTMGYLHAWVPVGESGYHYHNPWYLWYLLVLVQSRMPVTTRLATLT